MQLKQLKTFIAIADTGSFHAAADMMCVSQAAVSMQMKNLEEQLKIELFERSVRPPRLSNTALLILEQARQIVQLSENLLDSSPVSAQLAGSIRIGTIPGISFLLPDTICALRDQNRKLQVRVLSDFTYELVSRVLSGKLDAAVVSQPEKLDKLITARLVMSEPLVLLAPKSQTGQSDEKLLRTNPLISFNRRAEVSRRIEEALIQRRINVDPIMEIDTLETFQVMVQRGLGVGILPMSSIREHLRDKLYVVPFGNPPLQRTIVLVQRTDHHRVRLLDAFYQAMKSTLSDRNKVLTTDQL